MTPFALYRFPFSESYTLVTGPERNIDSLSGLRDARGFVLSPFCGGTVSLIASESVKRGLVCELEESGSLLSDSSDNVSAFEKESYFKAFDKFYNAIESGEFEKLVLSRQHSVKLNGRVSKEYLTALFKRACNKYKSAFVYVAYTRRSGVWFGCSPEVLVESEGNGFHSVALAGTMKAGDGEWSEKNRREQACVAGFVRDVVGRYAVSITESEPYSAEAGKIKHIKTDFSFELSDSQSVYEVALALQPTPAVCGLERDKAHKFIEANEGYDRSYYSGVVGVCGDVVNLYVNLRCVRLEESEAVLYAGGGLVKGSVAGDEWCETESKLQTIMSIL